MSEFKVAEPREDIVLNEDPVEEPELLEPDHGDADDPEGSSEQDDAPEASDAQPQKRERFVPLAALQEERRRRQEITDRFQQMDVARNQQMAVMQGRLDELYRVSERARAPAPEPEPNPQTDPEGWVRYNFARLEAENKALRDEIGQTREYFGKREKDFDNFVQQSTQDNTLKATLRRDEDEFREAAPDYDDAIEFLRDQRDRELERVGVHDPGARSALIAHEIRDMAQRNYSNGSSAAETAYELAKIRGYQGQRKPDAPQKLDVIRRGQQASRSLSSAPGSSPRGRPSLDQIANMSAKEFESHVKDFESFKRLHEI